MSLALSGSPKDGRDFPIIEIGLRVAEKGTNYCKLEWKVTNHSDITATFLDGNIEKYEQQIVKKVTSGTMRISFEID